MRARRVRTGVAITRAVVRTVAQRGVRGLVSELALRLEGRLVHGLPLSSPSSLLTLNREYMRRTQARTAVPPLVVSETVPISVVMPVHATPPDLLRRAIRSVQAQSYGRWELCVTDDGTPGDEVRSVLEQHASEDPRVQPVFLPRNQGISAATNEALARAEGAFVAFLDHDDELAPDALARVARAVADEPDVDVLYSDEDKLSERGLNVDPFLKPGWSPHLLRSMNYLTHLNVIRTGLVREVGGCRSRFDGSQDYDLFLRCTERARRVVHLPQVLYHWRKVPTSAAASTGAKPYAYEAARGALEDAMRRRGEEGGVTAELPGLYRTRYTVPPHGSVVLWGQGEADPARTRSLVAPRSGFLVDPAAQYIMFLGPQVATISEGCVEALVEHAQRSGVGVVGGVEVDRRGVAISSGLFVGRGSVRPAFAGWDMRLPLYFGMARAVRDASAVSSSIALVRRDVFEDLARTDERSHALLVADLCLRARGAGLAVVVTPYARALSAAPLRHSWDEADVRRLRARWPDEVAGEDPFLSPSLEITAKGPQLRPDEPARP
ncbi:MAG TPA: glycosyltransferase [Actinomycetota bacterium]|nr:glycosyltransferase [Actinomycetota bacterium]